MASDQTDGGLSRLFGVNKNPVVTTPTLVSGTALQPSPTKDCNVYIAITAGAGGTMTLSFGPTTGTENVICTTMAIAANSDEIFTVNLPAGWRVKVVLVTCTVAGTTVVTD